MKLKSCSIALCFGALLSHSAQAQVVATAACSTDTPGTAAIARCNGDRTARAEPAVARISPTAAALAKSEHGRDLLLLDVRSQVEAAFGGRVPQSDALVPYAEVMQPPRWDAARSGLALAPDPHFVGLAQAWIAALGGGPDTPLLLLCNNGEVATAAARVLRASGYRYVTVIDGGLEGAQREDGPQHAGWKAAGLPWLAHSDPAYLFGDGD
jgi:rhodanese-related sulfurtransferase